MSLTPTAPPAAGTMTGTMAGTVVGTVVDSVVGGAPGPRRVRHQAREVMVLMAFSAATSVAVATGILLLAGLGHAGR